LKPTINISVKSLVEFTLRSGSLELSVESIPDPIKAIRVHQKIQNSRKDDFYQSEISLNHLVEGEDFNLKIRGRVDGLYTTENDVIIEEIKTTLENPEFAASKNNILHWGQVKVYALIYMLLNQLTCITIRLCYCHLETLEEFRVDKVIEIEALQSFFALIINRYLKWMSIVNCHRIKRNHSAKTLQFPFKTYRPGQREMAVRVYHAIRSKSNIVIQAPTGIGKTMSALFSGIKAIGEGKTEKIYYLSARNTGHLQVENMLKQLGKSGFDYTYVRLSARERLCPKTEQDCIPDNCQYANGYYDRLLPALNDTFKNFLSEPDYWKTAVEKHKVCPHPFLLELSTWVDCVICDYNYMFDPLVNLNDFTEKNRPEYTVLLDEAHNLSARSHEMFSARIKKQKILQVRRLVKNKTPTLYKKLSGINTWMLKKSKECNVNEAIVESEISQKFLNRLTAFVVAAKDVFNAGQNFNGEPEVLDLFFEIIMFLKASERFDENYAMIYQKVEQELDIHLYCINTAKLLIKAIKKVGTVVFFSATLSPFFYYLDLFGLPADTATLKLGSPFPSEHFLTLIADKISTRYNHRQKTAQQVANLLHHFEKSNQGNLLFFFPSYAYLRNIYERYTPANSDTQVVVQQSKMSDKDRTDFLSLFTNKSGQTTVVGFAVMGGIFGEGIDLVGNSLTGVAVLGVGLPGISVEENLIKQHFDDTIGYGYDYAYVFPGMNRVLQAAGRVIRSENDKGILLLIDDRYSRPDYQSLMPNSWFPKLIKSEMELDGEIKQFWGNNE
jgi:DNA excision repair protein ERCC-2